MNSSERHWLTTVSLNSYLFLVRHVELVVAVGQVRQGAYSSPICSGWSQRLLSEAASRCWSSLLSAERGRGISSSRERLVSLARGPGSGPHQSRSSRSWGMGQKPLRTWVRRLEDNVDVPGAAQRPEPLTRQLSVVCTRASQSHMCVGSLLRNKPALYQ
jgi:hypothetical protein